jgi:hypothetical protein
MEIEGPEFCTANVALGPAAVIEFPAASDMAVPAIEIPTLVEPALQPVMVTVLLEPVPLTELVQPELLPLKLIAEFTVVLLMVPMLLSLNCKV